MSDTLLGAAPRAATPQIARVLRERGLDVEAVAERSELVEASDSDVLAAASREQRAVVTNNVKGFRPLATQHLADRRGHSGLILLTANRSRSGGATGRLADAIEAIMRDHPDGVADAEDWVGPVS